MTRLPRLTIVTPSYNQGEFIEETILSVIGQGYPDLEYIIMDGGSTDNSVEVIKKYEKYLNYWESAKDRGQSHAINKGFERSSGEVLGWLNSDDTYLPGTLLHVGRTLQSTRSEVLFGNCFFVFEQSPASSGTDVCTWRDSFNLEVFDYVIQPGAFWTRSAWIETGALNESLHYTLDWEWFIRARRQGVAFTPTNRYMAQFRFHASHKSSAGGDQRTTEILRLLAQYPGTRYAKAYRSLCANRDSFDSIEKWIYRFRLGKVRSALYHILFPNIFDGLDDNEVQGLRLMLPLPLDAFE